MSRIYSYETIIEEQDRKKDWEELSYHHALSEYKYTMHREFQKVGIECSHLTPEDWALLRQQHPIPTNRINEGDEKQALDEAALILLAAMLELGRWVLVIWLLRRKNLRSAPEDIAIDGDTNVVGNNNTLNINNPTYNYSVVLDRQQLVGDDVLRVLVIGDPNSHLRFVPLMQSYRSYCESEVIADAKIKLKSQDPNLRAWAVETIGEWGFKTDAESVIPLLQDPEPKIQKLVADVAVNHHLITATLKIRDLLETQKLPVFVAEAFALALLQLDHEEAIKFLVEYCASRGNTERIMGLLLAFCTTLDQDFHTIRQFASATNKRLRLGAVQLLAKIAKDNEPPELAGLRPELLLPR